MGPYFGKKLCIVVNDFGSLLAKGVHTFKK